MRNPIELMSLLERTPGKLDKLKILQDNKDNDILRRILVYGVDPKRMFHIRQIPDDVRGEGTNILSKATWNILDLLVNRSLTGNTARLTIFAYIKGLKFNEGVIVRRILRKKLRVGIAEATIRQVWPDEVPSRGLQKGEDWDPTRFVPGSYGSVKMDGLRAELRNGDFYSFGDIMYTGLGTLADEVRSFGKYANIDGELVIPGMDFDQASGIIRANDGRDKSMVEYCIFDNPAVGTLPLSSRLDVLMSAYPDYWIAKGRVGYLPHVPLDSVHDVDRAFLMAIEKGHEGIMVKQGDKPLFDGRNFWWMKRKKGWEGERYVVGVYEGEDDLHGTLGGVVIQTTDNTKTRVGSGFSRKDRDKYWADPTRVVGHLGTIVAMEKTKSGSLRHPVWKGKRRDLI